MPTKALQLLKVAQSRRPVTKEHASSATSQCLGVMEPRRTGRERRPRFIASGYCLWECGKEERREEKRREEKIEKERERHKGGSEIIITMIDDYLVLFVDRQRRTADMARGLDPQWHLVAAPKEAGGRVPVPRLTLDVCLACDNGYRRLLGLCSISNIAVLL